MKFLKLDKFKSLLLSGALALSLFVTGCSNADTYKEETSTNSNNTVTTESTNNSTVSSSISNLPETSNSEIPKDAAKATVERVVDGDTMKLKLEETGETVTLRLLLVDTPESVKKGVDPQPFSIEASNYTKNTLSQGSTVYIEYDNGSKTDKYDRHLGYLWFYSNETSSWKMFNEDIISKGYARVGYVYSQKRHLDKLNLAQDSAKSKGLNIWSVPGYVTDKGFDVDAYNKGGSTTSSSSNKTNSSTSSSSNNSSSTVYANGGSSSSNKYHSSPNAHNMSGAVKMTEKKAKSEGYVPCGLCY